MTIRMLLVASIVLSAGCAMRSKAVRSSPDDPMVLLYFNADPNEHAKALYQAARCFEKLGEQERANELFRELVRRYPGTKWATDSPIKPEPVGETGGG